MSEIAIWNLARFLAGATDADLNLIRQAWPDCPADGPESRPQVLAWLKAHPDLGEAVLKIDPARPPETRNLGEILTVGTEAWAGWQISELLADRIAFTPAWGWLVWDGKIWARDMGALRALAMETLTDEIAELIKKAAGDKERIGELARVLQAVQRRTMIDNALAFTQAWRLVRTEQFDQHPYLLNTQNGVVDLKTGNLLPHKPDLYLTQITAVHYDPAADCPRFRQFLTEIFDGNDRLISFVQRLLGYGLLGHNYERIFAVFWGRGANGKSTLCNILAGILGDYLKEARPESFETLRPGEVRARNDLAILRGARVVTINESREGAKFDAALVKQIAGGTDLITVRYLYREDFSYRPAFLPILRTNHKPHFPGGDPALWDRVRLVPFTVQIPEERQDKELAPRIIAEEGPGVLAWLVRGCIAYQREGLGIPPEVREATEEYRQETDPVWAFVCDACVQDPTAREETGKLYDAFCTWWKENGLAGDPISIVWFARTLTSYGFVADRGKKRYRLGLRLAQQATV